MNKEVQCDGDCAVRSFRLRELLDGAPDPEFGDLETGIRLVEEAIINLSSLLRDRNPKLRNYPATNPDRVGTSITNTNPDYSEDDQFPLGFPVGTNFFFKQGTDLTCEEKLLLGREITLVLQSCVQLRMSLKNGRNPELSIQYAHASEEAERRANELLDAINTSEKGNPIQFRSNRREKWGFAMCDLCRDVFCSGCPRRNDVAEEIAALRESRSTALDFAKTQARLYRKLMSWSEVAKSQLKSNKLIRWHFKITHER